MTERRTAKQKAADNFDMKLYALISAALTADASDGGDWYKIALRLTTDVRPLVRKMMHKDDVARTT